MVEIFFVVGASLVLAGVFVLIGLTLMDEAATSILIYLVAVVVLGVALCATAFRMEDQRIAQYQAAQATRSRR